MLQELTRLCPGDPIIVPHVQIPALDVGIRSVAVSPDGRTVAALNDEVRELLFVSTHEQHVASVASRRAVHMCEPTCSHLHSHPHPHTHIYTQNTHATHTHYTPFAQYTLIRIAHAAHILGHMRSLFVFTSYSVPMHARATVFSGISKEVICWPPR